MTDQETIKEIRAAFEREPRVHVHRNHIRMNFADGTLVIEGEVDDIAAKKLALELAGKFAGNGMEDRLRLTPSSPVADGALRDAIVVAMTEEPTLRNCAIRVWIKGQEETVRQTQPESGGAVHVFVEDGIVTLEGQVLSLSHKRLAGVLAWWAPGCRDVVNKLAVVPPEEDSDAEINDAVRLVLEKDPLLPAEQISVKTSDRIVTLEGLVFRDGERKQADSDAWYVHGVRNVINKLEVRQ
ncbi:MAG: BON domain-containing protein [Sulfuricella sp.]